MTRTETPRPSGIITFLFTDVEGSTRLWAADTETTAAAFVIHDKVVREAIESNSGYVFGTAGDSFRAAFPDATAGVMAARQAQHALQIADWPGGVPLRVRMALHRGRATERDGDYFGPVPNTTARIEGLAHGGQVLLSESVQREIEFPSTWLGEHRVRDVAEPVSIHQLGHDSFKPVRSVDPELSTLPNPGSSILGRETEISEIRGLLETSSLVTLTGTGGSGKTRLAIEVASHELPNRPDGCYFADLAAASDESELPAALATAVRLQLSGGDPIRQVVDHLAGREALVVLDNCEHLLEACADFAEALLARSASTMLLATTRQRLDVPGEQVMIVSSLPNVPGNEAAIDLFVARAQAADPTFEADEATRAIIAEICDQLDGIPLPIELAAARVAVLSPADLLARMEDRFRLLSGGRGRQRRRTLQATLDWSYDLLDPDEQHFFQRVGVFVGSFDLSAAVAVSERDEYEALDLLDSLSAKSLISSVSTSDGEGADRSRFRLLETVRIYAGDQLSRSSSISAARDAHLNHYHDLMRVGHWAEAEDLTRGLGLVPEWPNVASALEWATTTDQWETAAELALGCQGLWENWIPATEGVRWLESILDELEPGDLRGWLQRNLAVLAMELDDFETVHRLNEEVIATANPEARLQALAIHGFTRARQLPDESRRLLDEADAVMAEHGLEREGRCPVSWARGTLELYAGDLDRALDHFREAFEAARGEDHAINHLVVAGLSFATTQILAGQPDQAVETLDQIDWSPSVWDSSDVIRAVALIDLGRPGEAADLVIDYGRAALRGRLSRQSNDALVGLAALALHRKEEDRAWQLLLEAVTPRSPFTIGLAEALAGRMGRGDELVRRHRERSVPLQELDASTALRVELDRLAAD